MKDLRYTSLDHCMNSPIVELDQRFLRLKTAEIGLVGLPKRNVRSLVHSVELSVCRTIARRKI